MIDSNHYLSRVSMFFIGTVGSHVQSGLTVTISKVLVNLWFEQKSMVWFRHLTVPIMIQVELN